MKINDEIYLPWCFDICKIYYISKYIFKYQNIKIYFLIFAKFQFFFITYFFLKKNFSLQTIKKINFSTIRNTFTLN